MCRLLLCLMALGAAGPAPAQLLADTLFTWEGYARPATCHLRLYQAPPGADRAHTAVLHELAENEGPTTLADARHLAELVGRRYGFDPAAAYFVFHWNAASYEAGPPRRRKELFLRATFRRTKSGSLSTPTWRVLSREDVEDLTDRLFR